MNSKKNKEKYINWDDCIHIGACRRFAVIVEAKTGKKVSRGCGEHCLMYCSRKEILNSLQEGFCDYKVLEDLIEKIKEL